MSLGITLLVTLFVWNYYRGRTYVLADRYSTFGPRFWAAPVDSSVLWPITLISYGLLSLEVPNTVAIVLTVAENLIWLLYTVVMHARYGQTVGKCVTKVRVVDFRTEGRISWRQALLRESIPVVLSVGCFIGFAITTNGMSPGTFENGKAPASAPFLLLMGLLPLLWFVIEILTMLTNEKMRALHDFIAGTVVVRTNVQERDTQSGPPGGQRPPSTPWGGKTPDRTIKD